MTKLNEIAGSHCMSMRIPAQGTADTENEWVIGTAPGNIKVVGARWTPEAAVTGAATNHFSLNVRNRGTGGAGTVDVTAVKAYDNGVNSVAFAPEELTLATTESDRNVASGASLTLERLTPGSGLASPQGVIEIFYQYR